MIQPIDSIQDELAEIECSEFNDEVFGASSRAVSIEPWCGVNVVYIDGVFSGYADEITQS